MANLHVRFTTHVGVGNIRDGYYNSMVPGDHLVSPYSWHLGRVYLGDSLTVKHQSLPKALRSSWKVRYAGVGRHNTPDLLCVDFDHYWYSSKEHSFSATYLVRTVQLSRNFNLPSDPFPVTLEQIQGTFGPPPWRQHANCNLH